MSETALLHWLIRSACGGGALLLLCWYAQRCVRQPAHKQRLGEWGVVASLVVAFVSLFPSWLHIPVPGWKRQPLATVSLPDPPTPQAFAQTEPWKLPVPQDVLLEQIPQADSLLLPMQEAKTPLPSDQPWHAPRVVLTLYFLVVSILLGRWLLANAALWWLLRRRRPIPRAVHELFTEMSWPTRSRLIVTDRVQVPFSVGLFRPTVVLPESLLERCTTEELRWVLAHELSHLDRQDTRTCWLFALGQVLYFYLPWFWWLRREVRLSQEYLADAAAVEWAGSPVDYAQFLVNWARRPLACATGVSGSGSDLFRRVKMLLADTNRCESRCSRSWVSCLACLLLALGLVAGGVSLRAVAAEDKKDPEPKKEAPVKPERDPKQGQTLPFDFDKLFEQFGGLDDENFKEARKQLQQARKQIEQMLKENRGGVAVDPNKLLEKFGGLDDENFKEARKRLEEAQKQMERLLKQQPGGFGGAFVFPGAPLTASGLSTRPGRLGAQIRVPSKTLIEQLELPADQGIVLEAVGPNSAAAKAGLQPHDIVLELDGKTVPSKVDEFVKMIETLKANKPVDVVVLRKGKKETIKGLTLPEVKAVTRPALPGLPGQLGGVFAPGGLAGVARGGMTSITRNNDQFTARHQEGETTISITGTIDQGKAKADEIVIDEGKGQKATYTSLDKVPAAHKEKVEKLLEMSASGKVRVPLR